MKIIGVVVSVIALSAVVFALRAKHKDPKLPCESPEDCEEKAEVVPLQSIPRQFWTESIVLKRVEKEPEEFAILEDKEQTSELVLAMLSSSKDCDVATLISRDLRKDPKVRTILAEKCPKLVPKSSSEKIRDLLESKRAP